jgi:hypothetical protein
LVGDPPPAQPRLRSKPTQRSKSAVNRRLSALRSLCTCTGTTPASTTSRRTVAARGQRASPLNATRGRGFLHSIGTKPQR